MISWKKAVCQQHHLDSSRNWVRGNYDTSSAQNLASGCSSDYLRLWNSWLSQCGECCTATANGKVFKSNNNVLQKLGFSYHPDLPLYEIRIMWRTHTSSIPPCSCTGPCPTLTHTMASSKICPCLILFINCMFFIYFTPWLQFPLAHHLLFSPPTSSLPFHSFLLCLC